MLKPELIAIMANEAGITKAQATRALETAMKTIAKAIRTTGRFEYPGFGVFKKVRRAACQKHNPGDPTQKILVPAHNTVKFRPSPKLKELMKG